MAGELQVNATQLLWRRQVSALFDSINAWLAMLPSASYTGSKTYDPPSLANGTQAQTTVTATGATLGTFATASFSLDLQGIALSATASATNTVTVTFSNNTGGVLDLGSGTLRVRTFN